MSRTTTTRRAYPDVALLGHNYKIVVNGAITFVDGTSASAPVMAAFVSLVNAQRKSKGMSAMGYINPFLYKYYANFTNDITSGDNKCSAVTYEPINSYYSYYFPPYYLADTPESNPNSYSYNYYYSPSYQAVITCCEEGFYATRGWDPVTG